MAVYVLIHGMWHGGWCWERTAPLLRQAGHTVFTPTLAGLGERAHLRDDGIDWHTHVRDVVGLLDAEDLRAVRLVGHSWAGGLVLEAAHNAPQRIAHIVCLDALIPSHGKSYREQFPNFYEPLRHRAQAQGTPGWAPPPDWDFGIANADDLAWVRTRLSAHPLSTLESPLTFDAPAALALPRIYVSCTAGKSEEALTAEAVKWQGRGWHYRTLEAGHDAMIDAPSALAGLLLKTGMDVP